MNIVEWRKKQIPVLKKTSNTASLDADLLLSYVLKKSRAELIASTLEFTEGQEKRLDSLVGRRLAGEPIAYLIEHQPFWSFNLKVTQDTLIPRPETECLIEWILAYYDRTTALQAADLGTGSGAIALTLAKERPTWKIAATDISEEALSIAKQNAEKYQLPNITFHSGDWFAALPSQQYNLIVSNPPYVAENDLHLSQLTFEPSLALVSGKNGLAALSHIIPTAKQHLKKNGVLIVEHGYDQDAAVTNLFEKAGYCAITSHRDLADIPRFVVGKSP